MVSVPNSRGRLSAPALVHAESAEGRGDAEKSFSFLPFAPFAASREIRWMPPNGGCWGFGSHEGRKAGRRGGLLYFPGFRLIPRRHCERSAAIQSFPERALDCRVAALLAMTEIAQEVLPCTISLDKTNRIGYRSQHFLTLFSGTQGKERDARGLPYRLTSEMVGADGGGVRQ